MQTKITKTIRVSIDVKQHLDEMKGSVSASEFIETMLSYFERNGVDPRTSINGKFKTLELQGIERIIKKKIRLTSCFLHRKRTVMIC